MQERVLTPQASLKIGFVAAGIYWRYVGDEWRECREKYDHFYWQLREFVERLQWIRENEEALWQRAVRIAKKG